jgi:hypothetical protein
LIRERAGASAPPGLVERYFGSRSGGLRILVYKLQHLLAVGKGVAVMVNPCLRGQFAIRGMSMSERQGLNALGHPQMVCCPHLCKLPKTHLRSSESRRYEALPPWGLTPYPQYLPVFSPYLTIVSSAFCLFWILIILALNSAKTTPLARVTHFRVARTLLATFIESATDLEPPSGYIYRLQLLAEHLQSSWLWSR